MNLFNSLNVPAGDGLGTVLVASGYGRTKTFTIAGNLVGTITLLVSNDGTSYFPAFSIAGPGKRTLDLPCYSMRVEVSGYLSGTGIVDLSGTDEGVKYANLPVSAGDGVGAGVSASAMGSCKSILVGGTWTGTVIIEISEDNTNWAQLEGFTANGMRVRNFVANYMRVRRAGTSTGTPNVDVCAANDDNPESNLFGDGSDGDVTLSGNISLSRDMYYNTLNVGGWHLNTNGFRIFCKTELIIGTSGLVHRNGNDGVAETRGSGLGAQTLGLSSAGGDGGAFGAGSNGSNITVSLGALGGAGGAGTGGAGGTAGTVTGPSGVQQLPRAFPINVLGQYMSPGAAPNTLNGGSGGGGGGGDGADDEGGGGGGGGGVVLIAARKINLTVNTAAIAANGGDGADGTAAGAGGGGGGGGGCIILTYRTLDNQGSIFAAGGDGGASGGGGAAAGNDGADGNVFLNQV